MLTAKCIGTTECQRERTVASHSSHKTGLNGAPSLGGGNLARGFSPDLPNSGFFRSLFGKPGDGTGRYLRLDLTDCGEHPVCHPFPCHPFPNRLGPLFPPKNRCQCPGLLTLT